MQRFLIELTRWDLRRSAVAEDLAQGRKDYRRLADDAQMKILLDEVTDLRQDYAQLLEGFSRGDVAQQVKARRAADPAAIRTLRQSAVDLERRYNRLRAQVEGLTDRNLVRAWRDLGGSVAQTRKLLDALAAAKPGPDQFRVQQQLETAAVQGGRTLGALQAKTSTAMQPFQSVLPTLTGSVLDPQHKYDQSSRRAKMYFQNPPPG